MENIYKAFIKFQSEFKGMQPNGNNPFFKSTYITLDGILETTRPILAKHGLAILQSVKGSDGSACVKTMIIHESGEMIETESLEMKPTKNDPQAIGSCITYMKRYQLAALLGICESVDDDANYPTYGDNKPKAPNKNVGETPNNLSEAQLKRMYAIAHSKKADATAVNSVIFKKYHKAPEQMTKSEYDLICTGYENLK